jgi:hypothetical protein
MSRIFIAQILQALQKGKWIFVISIDVYIEQEAERKCKTYEIFSYVLFGEFILQHSLQIKYKISQN